MAWVVSSGEAQLPVYSSGKLFARASLTIRHTTFCINSLAHWTGLQPYTHEVTAKGNYVSRSPHRDRANNQLLALLTSGEGNHK